MKASNESCTITDIIANEDECESAIMYLNNLGANLIFYGNVSREDYPYGCYNIEFEHENLVFWNTNSSGTANVTYESYNYQICRLHGR